MAQAVHWSDVDDAASVPYLPAMHAVHTNDVLAAKTLAYRPTTQAVHTGPAVLMGPPALYVPRGHGEQPPEPATLP